MKKLIINYILFNLLLFNYYQVFSQKSRNPSFERMKAMKMTFIAEKIPFSNEDEIYFWEVFGKYETMLYKDIWDARNEYIKTKEKNDFNSYDDKEAEKLLDLWWDWKEKENKVWLDRNNELLKKLSHSFVLNILNLEEKFWRNMMRKRKLKIKSSNKEK